MIGECVEGGVWQSIATFRLARVDAPRSVDTFSRYDLLVHPLTPSPTVPPDVPANDSAPSLSRRLALSVVRSQQFGLVVVLVLLAAALAASAGSHADPRTGATVNNFLNKYTLVQMATDASAFAI